MYNHGRLFLWSAVVVLLPHDHPHHPFASLSCHSCILLCHRLPSAALPQIVVCPMHAICHLSSTLCPLPHVTCLVWSYGGVTFFLSQTAVVVRWHGLNMCCRPLVLPVAICCTLATCCGPHAGLLSSTLCPLPHVTGPVWSCGVLPSFCLRQLLCFGGMV